MTKFVKGREKLINTNIGVRLKLIRTKLSLSRRILADAVGVSYQQIQKYEMGKDRIPAVKLHQFANIFDVSMEYFFQSNIDVVNLPEDKDSIALVWENLPNSQVKMSIYMLMCSLSKPKGKHQNGVKG